MPVKIILSIFILSVFGFCQIQTKVSFGVSNMDIALKQGQNRFYNQDPKVGYIGGVSVSFGDKLYFEPGLCYCFLKSDMTFAGQNDIETTRSAVNIQMLRLPVLFGYSVVGSQRSPVNLRVFGGPSISVPTFVSASDPTVDLDKSNFKNFYLGFEMGAGVNLGIFFLDASWDYGMMNLLKDDSIDSPNNIYNLKTGIRF